MVVTVEAGAKDIGLAAKDGKFIANLAVALVVLDGDGKVRATVAPTLTLGLRPEHAALGGSGGWPLKVEMLEMLGAERLVYGRIGDAPFTVRIDATAPPPLVDTTVGLDLPAEHLHWFDAATGARVS